MAVDALPFGYRAGTTILHRLNPAIKLLAIFAISAAAFLSEGGEGAQLRVIIFLSCLTAFVAAAALCANIKPHSLLRGSRAIMIMLIFVAVFRAINFNAAWTTDAKDWLNRDGLRDALFFAWRIVISFSAGSLFFAVTTMTALNDTLAAAERRLRQRNAKDHTTPPTRPVLSLALSLMLMFIPRFFEKWNEARDAYRARGGKSGIREYAALIPLVVERMMECAANTALALESRL